jgi:hypothetical protein
MIWLPLVPLTPLLGLLPQAAKEKLEHIGIDAGRATRLSINIEWLLLFFLILVYTFSGGLFSPAGAITGLLTIVTGLDILYRVSADADHKQPGFYAIVGETVRFIRELREKDLPDDEPKQISGNDSKDDA